MSRINLHFISEDYTNLSSSTYIYTFYTVTNNDTTIVHPWSISVGRYNSGSYVAGSATTTLNLGNISSITTSPTNGEPRPNIDLLNPQATYQFNASQLSILTGQYAPALTANVDKPSNDSQAVVTYHAFVESTANGLRLTNPVFANTISLDRNSNLSTYSYTNLYVSANDTIQVYNEPIKIYYTTL